ncbi:hypothetical protein HGM15179_000757, partial [Zosterops borbonicus]
SPIIPFLLVFKKFAEGRGWNSKINLHVDQQIHGTVPWVKLFLLVAKLTEKEVYPSAFHYCRHEAIQRKLDKL